MIDKNIMKNHFTKNAFNYDTYAIVQKNMANQIINNIKLEKPYNFNPNILDIGCGTGYLTNLLYKEFKSSEILAIDIAKGMIEEASKKLNNSDIEFLCGDIEEVSIDKEYDLITSNAVFQWFNDIDNTFLKLYKALKTDGTIIISTFGKETFNELNTSFKWAKDELKIKDDLKLGQDLPEIDSIKDKFDNLLKKNNMNFYINAWDNYEYEYFNTVKDFLSSIKKIGANNSNKTRSFKSPSVMKKTIDLYEKNFREDNMIRATYHCIYIVVKKLK